MKGKLIIRKEEMRKFVSLAIAMGQGYMNEEDSRKFDEYFQDVELEVEINHG